MREQVKNHKTLVKCKNTLCPGHNIRTIYLFELNSKASPIGDTYYEMLSNNCLRRTNR